MTERATIRSGLAPYITIRGGRGQEAIGWYGEAFGATVGYSAKSDDGARYMHASLEINGAWLLMSDDFPEYMGGKETAPPSAVTLHLQVDDADAWWRRAVTAGAEITMPLQNQFWGDRYGQLRDPFGHGWSIGGPVTG